MSSIVLHSRSGQDGLLHLDVPVGRPDTEFEVEIVVRAMPVASSADHLDFLQQTAGAWQGEFERPQQLPLEERVPL
jgi:hypothetical protein